MDYADDKFLHWKGALNCATEAERQAAIALEALADPKARVWIECECVERITPSFYNTFVMRLMAAYPKAVLKQRVDVCEGTPSFVYEALRTAVKRYDSGIRLSNQEPAPSP